MINDIRDVKPPVDMPVDLWWLLWVMAAVAVIAALFYFFYRRHKPPLKPSVIVPARPAWETALERLEDLSHQQYPRQGMFKLFYSGLSDIVRHYLEDRFHIKAPEMTTEEFLNFVKTSAALKDGHKQILRDFLNGCDMVKFARHESSAHEAQANFDLARKLIEETRDGI